MGPAPEAPPGEAKTLNGLEIFTSFGGDIVLRVTAGHGYFLAAATWPRPSRTSFPLKCVLSPRFGTGPVSKCRCKRREPSTRQPDRCCEIPFPLITRMAQQKWPVSSALARVGRSPFNVGNIVPGVFTPVLAKHSESLPKGIN
jgi:hypothetical protein